MRRHFFGGIDFGGEVDRRRVLQHGQQVKNVLDVALSVVEQVGGRLGASHIFHDRILPKNATTRRTTKDGINGTFEGLRKGKMVELTQVNHHGEKLK